MGETIDQTQLKVSMARASSYQSRVPWSLQMSPWFDSYLTSAAHLDYGHSISLCNRMWFYGWFAGAAMVTPENSFYIFFDATWTNYTLNSYGKVASSFYQFTLLHDRGTPYIPVAIVMDHLTGFNGYEKYQWGYLDSQNDLPNAQYQQIRDLFSFQLFPSSDFTW